MTSSQDEFDRELQYMTIMYFIRQMLDKGLISEDEYRKIEVRNCEKLKPISGNLISGKFLLLSRNRGSIGVGKES